MKWRHALISIKSLLLALVLALALLGCSQATSGQGTSTTSSPSEEDPSPETEILSLPELGAADLDGRLLKVVATTSVIGDVAAQVGGDALELTTLIGPGQDPHSYKPAARDLTALIDAHVVLVNGWNLEEGLVDDLAEIAVNVPVVAISANIAPLAFGKDEHEHEGRS